MGGLAALVSPVQEYQDFDRMTQPQFLHFLAESELLPWQKDELRLSPHRGDDYIKMIFWHRLAKVIAQCRDFHNYVMRQSIFLPEDIKDDLVAAADALWQAIHAKRYGQSEGDFKLANEAWTIVKDKINPLHKSIGERIHKRLRGHAERPFD